MEILSLDSREIVPLPSNDAASALLLRSRSSEADLWLLLGITPGQVALNGVPLRTGIRVLADLDEIVLPNAGRMFFSTERLAVVQPCASSSSDLRCARCRRPIPPQSDAVACPSCNVWYHQTDELPCWTYAPCAMCGRSSDLDGTYRWSPEEL